MLTHEVARKCIYYNCNSVPNFIIHMKGAEIKCCSCAQHLLSAPVLVDEVLVGVVLVEVVAPEFDRQNYVLDLNMHHL